MRSPICFAISGSTLPLFSAPRRADRPRNRKDPTTPLAACYSSTTATVTITPEIPREEFLTPEVSSGAGSGPHRPFGVCVNRFEIVMKTQGEVEAAVCAGVSRFQQDYMGRRPKDITTHLNDDLI